VVEGVLIRELREVAQVPLADRHAAVAGQREGLGGGDLGRRQSRHGVVAAHHVDGAELGEDHRHPPHQLTQSGVARCRKCRDDAAAQRIAPGEQPSPRGGADRRAGVEAGEAHPLRGQAVDVRGLDRLASLDPQIAVAQVVRQDHDQVGARRRGARQGPNPPIDRLAGLLGAAKDALVDAVIDGRQRGARQPGEQRGE
jgi:hypothetical protein